MYLLIYQALPLIFYVLLEAPGHIVAVISPLVNLMKDRRGNSEGCGKGVFSIVYGNPEAWLKIERWRKVLSSDMYSRKLCAIAVDEAYVIKQW